MKKQVFSIHAFKLFEKSPIGGATDKKKFGVSKKVDGQHEPTEEGAGHKLFFIPHQLSMKIVGFSLGLLPELHLMYIG